MLKCGLPVDDNLDVYRLLDELIQIEKGSGRDFHVRNGNRTIINFKHCIEVPKGNSDPTTRSLAKSASKMMLDGSDK